MKIIQKYNQLRFIYLFLFLIVMFFLFFYLFSVSLIGRDKQSSLNEQSSLSKQLIAYRIVLYEKKKQPESSISWNTQVCLDLRVESTDLFLFVYRLEDSIVLKFDTSFESIETNNQSQSFSEVYFVGMGDSRVCIPLFLMENLVIKKKHGIINLGSFFILFMKL